MFKIFAKKINYANSTDKELLSCIRSEQWSNLNDNQKIAILQEVENRNAAEQERPVCKVNKNNKMDSYGRYSLGENAIEVNLKSAGNNNSYNILDTVYHEGEHAHQVNCIKYGVNPPKGLPKETREMCELEFNGYRHPPQYQTIGGKRIITREPIIEYGKRTCEADSRNFAVSKVMEDKEIFRGDPEYANYLQNTSDTIENYNSIKMAEIRKQQSELIWEARKNNDISQERYEDMTHRAWNQQEQPAFAEAAKLLDTIRREKRESLYHATQQKDAGHHSHYSGLKAEKEGSALGNENKKEEILSKCSDKMEDIQKCVEEEQENEIKNSR